ncbi:MAG: EamA family transporter [Wenzhouxiangella sp.]
MIWLWLVTLGWAFSFSLIAVHLSGQVDDAISVFIRVALAFLLFLPLWLRLKSAERPAPKIALALMGIGAVQIGLMYLFLFKSYAYLSVPALLLFTIFTPLYVTLIDELMIGRRRLPARFWASAGVAVLGAAIVRYQNPEAVSLTGFLLVQTANLCFAFGQVAYKRLPQGSTRNQVQTFGLFFLGATLVSGLVMVFTADFTALPQNPTQWLVLLWLGLGASGLGYLGWNLGARRVSTGELAAMNNLLIPAGILVNVLIWGRDTDWLRLVLGGLVIVAAVWLGRRPAASA